MRSPGIEEVPVPGDRPLHVVRGGGAKHGTIFLHGSCTSPDSYVKAFVNAAATHGGVIALEGDLPCKEDPKLRRWSPDTATTSARIDAALRAMNLPTDDVTLIGYSQGAERAEWLANRFPAKYTRFVLVAGPIVPSPSRFHHARAVALLAGRGDVRGNMADGARALRRRSIPAIYVELEAASPHHGELAPEADASFGQAFDWIEANGISKTPISK